MTGGGLFHRFRDRRAAGKLKPGAISEQLMADYTAEVQPKGKAAAA